MFGFNTGKEKDTYTPRRAVIDACLLYRDAKFESNLRRNITWRKARRLVREADPFGGKWTARSSGRAMRLTRRGLEVRLTHGVMRLSWRNLQDRLTQSRN